MNENEQRSEASEPEQNPEQDAATPTPPAGPPAGYQQPTATPAGSVPPPPGQWVYMAAAPAPQPQPASSGLRVAAGILLILLGIVMFIPPWLTSFVLLLSPGTIAAGIVVICKHRSRGRGAPTIGLWLASAGLAMGLFSFLPFVSQATGAGLLLFSVPVLILLNKDKDRDRPKPAKEPAPEQTLT